MRLVYELPVRGSASVLLQGAPAPLILAIGAARAEIRCHVEQVRCHVEEVRLTGISLALLDQPVTTDEPIAPEPGVEEIAFHFAAYIANSIIKQSGKDAIEPGLVLRKSPNLEPETDEEVALLARKKQRRYSIGEIEPATLGWFDPAMLDRDYIHASAMALYADGIRATDPFVKFELFYRVMEDFFPNAQNDAPKHLRTCHEFKKKTFEEVKTRVREWGRLRVRSVHPDPKGDPKLRRDDLCAIKEVRREEQEMESIALWLLHNPPPAARGRRSRSRVPGSPGGDCG